LIGAYDAGCSDVYCGPVWHVATDGNDETGDGSTDYPFATIQNAIDWSGQGDTVLVTDGTYTGDGNRDIDPLGKQIVIMSENGPDYTTIDCEADSLDPHRGYHIHSGEDTTTIIDGFTIQNGYAPSNEWGRKMGGGISCDSSGVKLQDCVIKWNYGNEYGGRRFGAGLHFAPTQESETGLVVTDCSFMENYGLALSVTNSGAFPARLTDCVFTGNTVGGVANYHYSEIEMVRCEFLANLGDGFLAENNIDLYCDSCVFYGNSGAGVHIPLADDYHAGINLSGCLFESNHNGGLILGIDNLCGSYASISDCTFLNNTGLLGGGISGHEYIWAEYVSVTDCLFERNTAVKGGGVYLRVGSEEPLLFSRCVFKGNSADSGAAIYVVETSHASVRFEGCTIAGNLGGGMGTVFAENSRMAVENGIIAHNDAGPAIFCGGVDRTPTLTCCDIFGNTGGDWVGCIADQAGINGNLSLDPLFCDTAAADYSIWDVSPCAPANNDCDTLIGALGVGCYAPTVEPIVIDTLGDNQHVISHVPLIQWNFVDLQGLPQTAIEIAVGTDDDWTYAEKWNPAPIETADTSVTYDGSPLVDGETCYLRVRVSNGVVWSNWFETTFRLNTPPSMPTSSAPTGWEVTDGLVTLWLQNALDAEDDALTYDFDGYHDTDCVFGPPIEVYDHPEGIDSTGLFLDLSPAENCFYCWRTRAYDGYEQGEWSTHECFYVDASPEAPSAPEPIYPADLAYNSTLYEMLPEFLWSSGLDPDPADTVLHKLELAIDPEFSFVMTVDSLEDNRHQLADSLDFDKQYWWRVTAYDQTALSSTSEETAFWTWTLGDVNYSHEMDGVDLSVLIDCLFISYEPLELMFVGDLNGDCSVDGTDLSVMINALFISYDPLTVPGCEPEKKVKAAAASVVK